MRIESPTYPDTAPALALLHQVDYVALHMHEDMELLLVLEGEVVVRVEDDDFALSEGGVLAIDGDRVHALHATAPNLLLALQIRRAFLQEAQCHERAYACAVPSHAEGGAECRALRSLIARTGRALLERGAERDLHVRALLSSLLYHLSLHFRAPRPPSTPAPPASGERLSRIIAYIRDNYRQPITLQRIASEHYLSVPYLSRLLKRTLGMPFSRYLASIRMEHAMRDMLGSDRSLTQIALDHGFPDLKRFTACFREIHGMTPSAYRRARGPAAARPEGALFSYVHIDQRRAIDVLSRAIDRPTAAVAVAAMPDMREASADARAGAPVDPGFRTLLTFASAHEGLRADLQAHVRRARADIGFPYARFHGIFSDRMFVYGEERGRAAYNFTQTDALIDFLLSIGVRPFLEIGFMPQAMARAGATVFSSREHVMPPRDWARWEGLVEAFVRHAIARYGRDEVERWRFEIWNEPELPMFWGGTQAEFHELFLRTLAVLRRWLPRAGVGGTGILYQNALHTPWLESFLRALDARGARLDFLTMHVYPVYTGEGNGACASAGGDMASAGAMNYGAPDSLPYAVRGVRRLLRRAGIPGLCVTEWNPSPLHRDMLHDTCYVAAYIAKSVAETLGDVDALGYWTISDVVSEQGAPPRLFHGGVGLIADRGIAKAGYVALAMLARLGDTLVARGEGYAVTKSGDGGVQILRYHAPALEARAGVVTDRDDPRRAYDAFEASAPRSLRVRVAGLARGTYAARETTVSRGTGSAFDAWVDMGAPADVTREEMGYLERRSRPGERAWREEIDGDWAWEATLEAHEVRLLELRRLDV